MGRWLVSGADDDLPDVFRTVGRDDDFCEIARGSALRTVGNIVFSLIRSRHARHDDGTESSIALGEHRAPAPALGVRIFNLK